MLKLDTINALLTTRLCKYLDQLELDMLVIHNKIQNFLPGKMIIQQGKITNAMYIITHGKAIVTARILGEGVIDIATLERGNFIGEISLLEDRPSAATVTAISDVKVLMITKSYFDMLSIFFPETKFKLIKAIAKEVCYRLQDEYYKINNFMKNADMIRKSMFGEIIKSQSHLNAITFEDTGIDIHFLKNSSFFIIFNEEEFKLIMQNSSLIKTSKNCPLITEGEKTVICYIIIQGAVQSSIVQENKFAKLSVFGPVSIFGSASCIDGSFPSVVNYSTCEAAVLLKFNETNLRKIQKHSVKLWYKLFELICRSIVSLERAADKLEVRLNSEVYNR